MGKIAKKGFQILEEKPGIEKKYAIIQLQEGKIDVLMRGRGHEDFPCANCGFIILENIDRKQIQNIVFRCPKCKKLNYLPYYIEG